LSEEERLDGRVESLDGLQKEITLDELDEVLGLTIFEDMLTKRVIFCVCLLTFTANDQQNIVLTGETSIGKTYNLNEVLWFFPEDCINRHEGASPTSFIHRQDHKTIDSRTMEVINIQKPKSKKEGGTNEEWEEYWELLRHSAFFLDCHQKILVFPDMPHTKLLAYLRPLISHDRKVCKYSITEKKKSGLRTKDVYVEGFFTSIHATSATEIDEQEISRHYLLTPSDDKKKLQKSLERIGQIHSDPEYKKWYETEPSRVNLKARVEQIRGESIQYIYIPEGLMHNLLGWFGEKRNKISPKTQRDLPRLIGVAKAWCLFNWGNRKREGEILWCNETDITTAQRIYSEILQCSEMGVTPEEYSLWLMISKNSNNIELSIQNIHSIYFENKKRCCSDKRLRGMLKNLSRVGSLREEKKGAKLLYSINREEDLEGVEKPELETRTDKFKAVLDFISENKPTNIEVINRFMGQLTEAETERILIKLEEDGLVYRPDFVHYQKLTRS